jgi:hypothetical protein
MRFVVVQIPDNDEATAFMQAVTRGEIIFGKQSDEGLQYSGPSEPWKISQVYAVPTKLCECTRRYPEAKTKKYGWYVCTNCSKPRAEALQHPYNLLETHLPVAQRAFYMGFRPNFKGYVPASWAA